MSCRASASARATGSTKPKPTARITANRKSFHPFPLRRRSVMFDKVSQAAEKLATNVSRRAFLGRLGHGALVTAGVLGAMLAFGGEARADRKGKCVHDGGIWCGGRCCPDGRSCFCTPRLVGGFCLASCNSRLALFA